MAPVLKPTVSTMIAVLVACNLTAIIMWQLRGNADVVSASTIADLKAELARVQAQGVADHAEFQKLQKTLRTAIAQQASGGGAPPPGGVTARSMQSGEVDPVVLVMCLSDSTQGQIDEIQVALKSMLYNAPPPGTRFSELQIFFLVGDEISFKMVTELVAESRLNASSWPIPTSLDIIHVGALHERFAKEIVRSESLSKFWIMHRIGAWWRLMLPWMLPSHVKHVIYIDTDAWFRDNVAGMWLERNSSSLIQWGKAKTSGVIMLNLPVMKDKMWRAWSAAACAGFRENRDRTDKHRGAPHFIRPHINAATGDQAFFQCITEYWPDLEGYISEPFGGLHGATMWRLGEKWADQFEGGAVMHHNGGGKQTAWAYWDTFLAKEDENGKLQPPAHNTPVWRTATFFADLPWHWLVFHGKVYNKLFETAGYPFKLTLSHVGVPFQPFEESLKEVLAAWDHSQAITNGTGDCRAVLLDPK